MLNTILWATDGSDNAARALPWAKALLKGDDALLIAVHIVQEPASVDRAKTPTSNHDLLANIQSAVAEAADQGLKSALKVANYVGSQPAQAIADIAREVDADVIVVGTRGHSRIGGLLVGSVAQNLLKLAPCPVLSVPPGSEMTLDEAAGEAVAST
jgi:nucleotide-binding universal stress UspA family protein